ncbi:MAG: DUF3369 domain-containing protein [Halodesulfovibrio sp.]
MSDDDLLFPEDAQPDSAAAQGDNALRPHAQLKPWKILIVDDEIEVHNTTRLVLTDFTFEGAELEILSAYTGKEALEQLRQHDDIAVVLLDVVMETPHAGLDCARAIRQEMNNRLVRIILRTGQPGQAPERKVIVEYDINDYKHKTELTSQRLFTTIYTAIRSYRDMRSIEKQRVGLKYIIDASASFFQERSIHTLSKGVLTQIEALFRLQNSLYMSSTGFTALAESLNAPSWNIISATGKFEECEGSTICRSLPQDTVQKINEAIQEKSNLIADDKYIAYLPTQNKKYHILYVEKGSPDNWEELKELLEIFTTNVGIAFDNIYLNDEIIKTQSEVLFRLGEVVETRSKETAYHVVRVAEYTRILALAHGVSAQDAELFKQASPMHDIGKIGIPDSILLKPGKLTDDEFAIMKQHTTIGHSLLKTSDRRMLTTAADIAYTHHERWDGTGYPRGLKGEEIPLEGRITAVADVFDALSHERVYKKAWPMEEVLAFFHEQKGKMFDPALVELLLNNLDALLKVKEHYTDNIPRAL